MKSAIRVLRAVASLTMVAISMTSIDPGVALAQAPQSKVAPQSKFVDVGGVKLHYLIAGKGDPVLLLHGYGETSHMWLPLMAKLADKHTVIAPDLRGFGESTAPADGYTKAAMAQDIHALMKSLKYDRIRLVGHDIGLMVAYAYAAQYASEVDRLVLMEAFLPGVGDWNSVFLLRDLWHFHFYGKTPLALVTGRERIYLEHFWNDFAADPKKSVPEQDREFYARAYAQPGHMAAGMEVFRAFPKDAEDFAQFAKTRLTMPLLVLSGEKASGPFLFEQGKIVATNVEGALISGSGHWLMEEAPDQVIPKLVEFLNR
jgi:pimeloyl-ACP methyl ester carboxylesterase